MIAPGNEWLAERGYGGNGQTVLPGQIVQVVVHTVITTSGVSLI